MTTKYLPLFLFIVGFGPCGGEELPPSSDIDYTCQDVRLDVAIGAPLFFQSDEDLCGFGPRETTILNPELLRISQKNEQIPCGPLGECPYDGQCTYNTVTDKNICDIRVPLILDAEDTRRHVNIFLDPGPVYEYLTYTQRDDNGDVYYGRLYLNLTPCNPASFRTQDAQYLRTSIWYYDSDKPQNEQWTATFSSLDKQTVKLPVTIEVVFLYLDLDSRTFFAEHRPRFVQHLKNTVQGYVYYDETDRPETYSIERTGHNDAKLPYRPVRFEVYLPVCKDSLRIFETVVVQ